MSSPTFGTQLVTVAKAIAEAEKASGNSEAEVTAKQEEIAGLEKELNTLTSTDAKKKADYKSAIDDLKTIVDREHDRLNPPGA